MRSRFAWNILFARMHSYSLQHKYDKSCLTDYFEVKTDHTVNIVQILYIGVGRFRILGGPRFRILGGGQGGPIPSRHMTS